MSTILIKDIAEVEDISGEVAASIHGGRFKELGTLGVPDSFELLHNPIGLPQEEDGSWTFPGHRTNQ